VPITIGKIEVNINVYIFDILDFDLVIGHHLENLLHTPLGSLYEKLGKLTSTTPCFENPLAKPCPKQNPLEMMMHEQTSSSPIVFKPRPSSPHFVVLDHDRDTTMIIHNEPLGRENHQAREFSEALTLESKGKESVDGHASFILESPSPCPYNILPELATLRTTNASRATTTLRPSMAKCLEGWL